ncbi:MAG: hypothetical protein EXR98_09385 [Gemmataceae bacterium]|nr:hypothetical protein [Gemmataceae bacterium]
MAITLQCPRCSHEQKIDDSKAGQEVPCKICHHKIKVGAAPEKAASMPTPAPSEKKSSPDGVQAGLPSATGVTGATSDKKGRTAPASKDTSPKSKKAKDRDGDADESRPRPRPASEGSAGLLSIGIAGGVVLVVMLLCGSLGLGGYFLIGSSPRAVEPFAQNDHEHGDQQNDDQPRRNPNPPNQNQNPPPNQNQFPKQNPFPNNPFPNPPPAQENLDTGNPKHIDRVLPMLKGSPQERGQALNWLNGANPMHPRRAEVAQMLDGLVGEYLDNPPALGNDGLFNPYFKWITKDNVPTLIRVVRQHPLHGLGQPLPPGRDEAPGQVQGPAWRRDHRQEIGQHL